MYVKRDDTGAISMTCREPGPDCTEWVEPDSPELKAYFALEPDALARALEESDRELVRVLEDLVEVLTDKGVIRFTDLPLSAQEKLRGRKRLRASGQGLDLMVDDDDTDL